MERTSSAPEVAKGTAVHGRQLLTIMVGVLLCLLLSALDATVVGPAMFRILADLQGLEHYAWVTTAYLLTSTVTVPIAGKLGDLYGRKWFMVGGMVLFVLASALCGLSRGVAQFSLLGLEIPGLTTGMAELIFFRALQGIGGGLVTASAFAILADVVAPAERARWQGLFGGVWGLSSILGPALGGYITDNLGWQWVFYVNIPVGLVAVPLVVFAFPHIVQAAAGRRTIDWAGALTLVAAITPILLALSLGGTKAVPWISPLTIGMVGAGLLLLALFLRIERHAADPLIPLDLFKNRIFSLSVVTALLTSLGMYGALINLPLFIQGVQGRSATASGNAIIPMMLGSILFSIVSGQILSRTGRYRVLAIVGQVLLALGFFLLASMNESSPDWQPLLYMVAIGLGLGLGQPIYTLIVQNSFPPQRLGIATSSMSFFNSIGGTIGVAVLGTIINNRFNSEYAARLPAELKQDPQLSGFLSALTPQQLISPGTVAALGQQLQSAGLPGERVTEIIAAITAPIKAALGVATTQVFFIAAVATALSLIAVVFIPEIPLARKLPAAPLAIEGGGATLDPEPALERVR